MVLSLLLALMGPARAESLATSGHVHGSCLRAFAGANQSWKATNNDQATFVRAFLPGSTRLPEIDVAAGPQADPLNALFERHGVSLRIRKLQVGELGCAVVLDMDWTWLESGSETSLSGENQQRYSGVSMNPARVEFWEYDTKQPYVLRFETKEGYTVWMSKVQDNAKLPTTEIELLQAQAAIAGASKPVEKPSGLQGVIFPKVNLTREQTPNWLMGLKAGDATLREARNSYHLTLDAEGGSAQVAGAYYATRGMGADGFYRVNRTFYLWVTKPGVEQPLVVALVDYDAWTAKQ